MFKLNHLNLPTSNVADLSRFFMEVFAFRQVGVFVASPIGLFPRISRRRTLRPVLVGSILVSYTRLAMGAPATILMLPVPWRIW